MCSISGAFHTEDATKKTLAMLAHMKNRGKDAYGLYTNDKVFLGKSLQELKEHKGQKSNFALAHALHAIVGFVPEPLLGKESVFVANCEIYNWKELSQKYKITAKNDAELLHALLDMTQEKKTLREKIFLELRGPYAFAYLHKDLLLLQRDYLGEKPLYYVHEKNGEFYFASENKALSGKGKELCPRQNLTYSLSTQELSFSEQKCPFKEKRKRSKSFDEAKKELSKYFLQAVRRQSESKQSVGLLFSGGIDSTLIALKLQELQVPFVCYTAYAEGGNIEVAEDFLYAKEIAQKYGFPLKVVKVSEKETQAALPELMKIIESDEYMKVSVALSFYFCARQMKKDKVRICFSGLGSEELFAGYRRHKKVEDVNEECLHGLLCLHERDLYRDDLLMMSQGIELRLPYLDYDLIHFALPLDPSFKLRDDKSESKIILREYALDLGLDLPYAYRKKKAAQYGSKFDKMLLRLAKKEHLSKQEFTKTIAKGSKKTS